MESRPHATFGKGEFRAVLECPECHRSCLLSDDECPTCGLRFRPPKSDPIPTNDRTVYFDTELKLRYTETTRVPLGPPSSSRHRWLWMAVSLLLGAVAISIGAFMAYFMPFGFECGMIFVFVGALLIFNVYLTSDVRRDRVDGGCPNCGSPCSVSIAKTRQTATARCSECRGPFRYTGSRFEESAVS